MLSDAEEQKCLDLAGNATARNVKGTLQCVRGLNTRDCMEKIKVHKKQLMGKVDSYQKLSYISFHLFY